MYILGRVLMSALNPEYDVTLARKASGLATGRGWLRTFSSAKAEPKLVPLRDILVDLLSVAADSDLRSVESARLAERRDIANRALRWHGVVAAAFVAVILIAWGFSISSQGRSAGDAFVELILPLMISCTAALIVMWVTDYYLGSPERVYLAILAPIAVTIGWGALDAGNGNWGLPLLFGAGGYAAAALASRHALIERLPAEWQERANAPWTWPDSDAKRKQAQTLIERLVLACIPILPMAMLWEASWGTRIELRNLVFEVRGGAAILRPLVTTFYENRIDYFGGVWWTIPAGLAALILLYWESERCPRTHLEALILIAGILGLVGSSILLWPLYGLLIVLALMLALGALLIGFVLWIIAEALS